MKSENLEQVQNVRWLKIWGWGSWFQSTYVSVYTPSSLLRILRVFHRISTNKSLKITQKPPSNLPRDMEPLPWKSLTSLWWYLQFKVGSKPPESPLKYLKNFQWYRAQELNSEPPCLEVGCTTTWAIGAL